MITSFEERLMVDAVRPKPCGVIFHFTFQCFPFRHPDSWAGENQKKKKAEIEAINVFKVLDLDSDVYAPVIIAVPRELQSDVRVTSLLLSRTCIQYFKNEKKKTKFYI